MDRRTVLRTCALALGGVSLGGCAARTGPPRASARRRIQLPIVRISWDRVIRTTVGLRPHRPSGFVLRADRLDGKVLIHNYGHGGAGHSLGWGTGLMAADMALQQEGRRAAVIGCGTVGLSTARQLQRRGFDVTIYAKALPPETTSNAALAGFTPTSGLISGERTAAWDAQFRRAVAITYHELQLMAGPLFGVSWIDSYNTSDEEPLAAGAREGRSETSGLLPESVQTGRVVLGPGEHPFGTKYAVCRPTIRIEPTIYLDALVKEFLMFGGRLVVRAFDTPAQLANLDEAVILNCTGLGSRDLFGDEELMPVKGQLTMLVPQPEVNYRVGGNGAYTMPRSDGIALGGTNQRNVWSLEPDEEARAQIVESGIRLFGAMRPPAEGARLSRSLAPASVPPVESFFALDS